MAAERFDRQRLRRRFSAGGRLLVVAVLFVVAVVASSNLLRGARVDLTDNRLYTVSEGTRQIASGLESPVSLHFFFSETVAADYPAIRTYAQRVRELLQEIAARSGGRVELEIVDPLPFSEDEDRAVAFGLEPIPVGSSGQSVFLGLAGRGADDAETVLPFFQPDKEAFLEYDIAKLLLSLSGAPQPVVGVLSGLTMGAAFDPQTGQMSPGWVVDGELRQLFEVRRVGRDADAIDIDIDLLMVVHPKQLPAATEYAIDQFVLGGGRLVVFVDPYAEADPDGLADALQGEPAPAASTLPRLFAAWGIEFDPNLAVLDAITAMQVQNTPDGAPVRHPALLGLGSEQMNADDIITADLQALNLASAGFFDGAEDASLRLEPLLHSSATASTIDARLLGGLEDPDRLFDGFQSSNRHYVLAARLSGRTDSAFPEFAQRPGHVARSLEEANIIVVGDTDLLSDRLWVQSRNFAGQRVSNAFADNGNFVVNAVDNLLGSDALISVRTRPSSQRPFDVVESLRRLAEDRYRAKERELQAELLETERRLAALEEQAGEGGLGSSPQLRGEAERFEGELLRIRRDLREVRFQLDAEIQALGARLKFLNIVVVPLLVTLFALVFAFVQARRRRRALAAVD